MYSVNNFELLNPFNLYTIEEKLAIKKLGRSTPDWLYYTMLDYKLTEYRRIAKKLY